MSTKTPGQILIKLGSVPFLNVRPLMLPLEEGLVEHDFEILYTPPSGLTQLLCEKKVDLGLIPVAELIKTGNTKVVPNVSISSFGKVESVVLVTKGDLGELSTVAVDSGSRSSTALLRIILEVFNKSNPSYVSREPGEKFLDGVDGGMLIGNNGLKLANSPPIGYKVFDLGEIWSDETGLPFVYAVYAVNNGVRLGRNLGALEEAKSLGLKSVEEIARMESKSLGLPVEMCLRYLTERIGYDLGEKEMRGILAYSHYLAKLGEIDEIADLRFYAE